MSMEAARNILVGMWQIMGQVKCQNSKECHLLHNQNGNDDDVDDDDEDDDDDNDDDDDDDSDDDESQPKAGTGSRPIASTRQSQVIFGLLHSKYTILSNAATAKIHITVHPKIHITIHVNVCYTHQHTQHCVPVNTHNNDHNTQYVRTKNNESNTHPKIQIRFVHQYNIEHFKPHSGKYTQRKNAK